MELPEFLPGSTMIAEERWHDLLWSAVPHRVVSSKPAELITYVANGTVATRASNRGMPGTESLNRDQRKLLTLRSRQARVAEVYEAPDKLFIRRPDRWSTTILGWDPVTGEFRGWYVNFELPTQTTSSGIVSMDLVLDLWVDPDRSWHWKDEDDFRTVLEDGTLDRSVAGHIEAEAADVLTELRTGTGAFNGRWLDFHPDPDWAVPELPERYAWASSAWTFPPGPRLSA
ncbi:hypothetical protein GCM10011575_01160 [Microlunatus endophyticus]|uniref:DUF402 domain-containing protein n=1 Tax=Microlunatus endophyticus TaxID=1716077 RepID=A0A917W0E8_9ACTN|nr:DUF402 domain-containing protein [Microlunatus endophyticus]GGL47072.1 hypothetical protein GCM10011575_01160 [Microlunatus endophyticus]